MPQGYVDQDIPGSRIGDSYTGRIVDPGTGGGLFNPDLGYESVGIDPLTGADAPTGTDMGFSAPIRRYIQTGVINGDFSFPPPDPTKNIGGSISDGSNDSGDYNPLPGWLFVPATNGSITAMVVADGASASGYVLRWTATAVTNGDDAYIEAIVPVLGSRDQAYFNVPFCYWAFDVGQSYNLNRYIAAQFLKADAVTTTGTSAEISGGVGGSVPTAMLLDTVNSGVLPSDAAWLRVRIGLRALGTVAGPVTTDLFNVAIIPGIPALYLVDQSLPTIIIPASIKLDGGTLGLYTTSRTIPSLSIENSGRLISSGTSTALNTSRYSADALGADIALIKSRSATLGVNADVVSGDRIGGVLFKGIGNGAILSAAQILGEVDATPGANDMPGRLTFWTTPDASATPAERMRIDNAGKVGIGVTAFTASGAKLETVDGITFPATEVASANVNTLDDYAEGTWTPGCSSSSGTLTTVGTKTGTYTKVGRLVTATISLTITNNGTGAGAILTDVPFGFTSTVLGYGRESGVAGFMLMAMHTGANLAIYKYDGSYPAGNGYVLNVTVSYHASA